MATPQTKDKERSEDPLGTSPADPRILGLQDRHLAFMPYGHLPCLISKRNELSRMSCLPFLASKQWEAAHFQIGTFFYALKLGPTPRPARVNCARHRRELEMENAFLKRT